MGILQILRAGGHGQLILCAGAEARRTVAAHQLQFFLPATGHPNRKGGRAGDSQAGQVVRDQLLQSYLKRIGERLGASRRRGGFPFTFTVLHDPR